MGLDHGLWIKRKAELESLCIWRKNNAIHNYICTYVAKTDEINCKNIPLSKKHIQDLYEKTLEVLAYRDENISRKLLPTVDGFFFGSTDYNDIYYLQIQKASDDLKKTLKYLAFDEYKVYYHSWY